MKSIPVSTRALAHAHRLLCALVLTLASAKAALAQAPEVAAPPAAAPASPDSDGGAPALAAESGEPVEAAPENGTEALTGTAGDAPDSAPADEPALAASGDPTVASEPSAEPAAGPAADRSLYRAHAHLRNGSWRPRPSATSDQEIEIGALRAVPRRDAQDYLSLAPGVVLMNHAGIGHAQSMFLRGFDAGEGQDLEVSVDGVPINEPSNPHGHGYADVNFVIPEVVERLHVQEGPFDPRQGDFAIAGSVGYELAVRERGLRAQFGYGSFAEQRALLLWAPTEADDGTFAAVDLRRGDGFGPNRAHASVSALARYAGQDESLRYSLLLGSHALDFDSAGVIREDAYEGAELPCPKDADAQFFCVVDPNQGGAASRHLFNAKLSWHRPDRTFHMQAFGMLRDLRMRENFTGALYDPRGDGLDQGYETGTVGARSSYALTPRVWGRRQRLELGLFARHDTGRTRMWRLRRESGIPYASVFDRGLSLTNVAGYVRGEVAPTRLLTLLGGVRLDAFQYSTEDHAAPSEDREGSRLPTDARDAWATAASPRASLIIHAQPTLDWTTSAGLGLRSSDAQALSEGEDAPFARALALETGPSARFFGPGELALEARAFAFATRVEQDLLFDPERGRNVPVGPSNRYGATLSVRARVGERHDTLASLTWTEARQSSPSDGLFTFRGGPVLPFVPRIVARIDQASTLRFPIGDESLLITLAGGLGFIGPRPLPLAAESDPIFQLDLGLRARYLMLELGLSMENLFDRRNHAADYNYASFFGDETEPASRRSALHFAAAPPRQWLLTLTAYIDDVAVAQGDET